MRKTILAIGVLLLSLLVISPFGQTIINGVLQIGASNFTGVSTFASGSTTTFSGTTSFTTPALFANGTSSLPSIAFSSTPALGLYYINSTNIGITGNLLPAATTVYNLGSVSSQWNQIYASGLVQGLFFETITGATSGIYYGTSNAFEKFSTPTLSGVGFGTSASIVGSSAAFRVTLGNPVGQSGIVLFNGTFAFGSIPVVMCRDEVTAAANPVVLTTTAGQVTIASNGGSTFVAADTVVCSVQGLP